MTCTLLVLTCLLGTPFWLFLTIKLGTYAYYKGRFLAWKNGLLFRSTLTKESRDGDQERA